MDGKFYTVPSNSDLVHHGILGQRWGKRNGPPYPLDASDHSASEKKAGWRSSLFGRKKRKAEEEARRKAEEEARRKAEEEARRKAEEEARRKAEDKKDDGDSTEAQSILQDYEEAKKNLELLLEKEKTTMLSDVERYELDYEINDALEMLDLISMDYYDLTGIDLND